MGVHAFGNLPGQRICTPVGVLPYEVHACLWACAAAYHTWVTLLGCVTDACMRSCGCDHVGISSALHGP